MTEALPMWSCTLSYRRTTSSPSYLPEKALHQFPRNDRLRTSRHLAKPFHTTDFQKKHTGRFGAWFKNARFLGSAGVFGAGPGRVSCCGWPLLCQAGRSGVADPGYNPSVAGLCEAGRSGVTDPGYNRRCYPV